MSLNGSSVISIPQNARNSRNKASKQESYETSTVSVCLKEYYFSKKIGRECVNRCVSVLAPVHSPEDHGPHPSDGGRVLPRY